MRAEVVQGELVLSPSPSRAHQIAVVALIMLFEQMLPDTFRVVPDIEWRFDVHGFVAKAPRPDLVVVPRADDGPLVDIPILAVEVLSPTDHRPLTAHPMLRVDGKILDYAANGLRHYLEISLGDVSTARLVTLELNGSGRVVHSAEGDELFEVNEPFAFSFRPSDLLA